MKVLFFAVVATAMTSFGVGVTDVYHFKAVLRIPQVVNNTESLGKRVFKSQTITGEMRVKYSSDRVDGIEFSCLTNRSFSVRGTRVVYTTFVDGFRLNVIGNNATGVFRRPTLWASMEALPSYVAGYEPTDDNSLVIQLSGTGASVKKMAGNVTGTLGCGCTHFGHVSPTRQLGPCGAEDRVDDVAAVYGRWTAKRMRREFSR